MTAPAKNVVAQPSVAEGAKPLHERIAEHLSRVLFSDREDTTLLREAAEALRNAEGALICARHALLLEASGENTELALRAIDVVLSTGRMR